MTSRLRRVLVACALSVAWAAAAGAAEAPTGDAAAALEEAIFAGGCFWCMEHPFDRLDGVVETTVGYTGGSVSDPTYEQVSEGGTGHAEAVRVRFDPSRIGYERLLAVYWRNIDPLNASGQFCDHGSQYRSAIFATSDEQARIARASKRELDGSGHFERPIVTGIEPARTFFPAEPEHQDFADKHPIRYRVYRYGCGRDRRLEELWGDEAGGEPIAR